MEDVKHICFLRYDITNSVRISIHFIDAILVLMFLYGTVHIQPVYK